MQRQIQTDSSSKNSTALPILLDQKQLAQYLGKSTAWCERARWAGEGPKFIKLGRHVRYLADDVAAWIEIRSELEAE
jgi:predicted DNA-binding transcriptional regulator AlpA